MKTNKVENDPTIVLAAGSCPLHSAITNDCGCWAYFSEPETIHRHSFRFFEGDRVFWSMSRFGPMRGVTGTVVRGGSRIYVQWDEHCKNWAPTSFPNNFEISHLDPEPPNEPMIKLLDDRRERTDQFEMRNARCDFCNERTEEGTWEQSWDAYLCTECADRQREALNVAHLIRYEFLDLFV